MTLRAPVVMAVLLMLSGGCAARHGRPLVGGSTTPNPSGTISGNVRTVAGVPIEGRQVSAIEVKTGAHYEATTSAGGGYTIQVPTGRYRLEVELRGGETVSTRPAPTNVNVSDLDEELNFVIGF